MKTVVIPNDRNPWTCTINGVKYSYEAGTTQNVPDEVAALIHNQDVYPPEAPETDPPFNAGDVEDVQVNGVSVVEDGVANVPLATASAAGVVEIGNGLQMSGNKIFTKPATNGNVDSRTAWTPIASSGIDYAVKAAMCDGVGAAWTDDERLAALARMGCTVDENGVVHFTAQS